MPHLLSKSLQLGDLVLRTGVGTAQLLLKKSFGTLDKTSAQQIYQPWARSCIERIGGRIFVEGTAYSEPCILVGNHMSYLDIPLIWSTTDAVFVSKAEIRNWPLIGTSAKALGTIFVTRSSASSRAETSEKIAESVLAEKKTVCIFPEGTSSIEGKAWKHGVFKIAQRHGVKVQPFRIFYSPSRAAAFINDDALLPHAWNLMNYPEFQVSLKFFDPVEIHSAPEDTVRIQNMVQDSVRACLSEEEASQKGVP